MITKQMLNINQKIILKRIEILTMLEFTVNWILFIMQEYLMHSWFFFITIFTYLILNIVEIHIIGYSKQLIPLPLLLVCLAFLVILLIITTLIYGIKIQVFMLLLQILFICLKIKLRSFLFIGHQDRQQHIQLETFHAQ